MSALTGLSPIAIQPKTDIFGGLSGILGGLGNSIAGFGEDFLSTINSTFGHRPPELHSIAGADGMFSAEYKHQFETAERHRQENLTWQKQSIAEEREWQEKMSKTQIQRLIADAQAAGINPIFALEASGSASARTGAGGTIAASSPSSTSREQFEMPLWQNPSVVVALIQGLLTLLGRGISAASTMGS